MAKVNGVEYALKFTLSAWANIEEAGIPIESIKELGKPACKSRVRGIIKVFRIMANEALGREELTDDYIIKNTSPKELQNMYKDIVVTIKKAEEMETEDPDKERDLVLEEIQKKSEPTA